MINQSLVLMVILHKENRVFSTSNYEKTLLSRIFI